MTFSTFTEYQNTPASEKEALVILNASERLLGWVLDSGSIYYISSSRVVASIEDSGSAYTEVSSKASIIAGTYYVDRTNSRIYLQASDSSNPNSRFLVCEYRLHYSFLGSTAPNDLSTGFEVQYRPLLKSASQFGVELDNSNIEQIGTAIEGSGKLSFFNDQGYWDSIFDKLSFENKKCLVYSWTPGLPISEAKIIYKGKVNGKSWSPQTIDFSLKDQLNELRANVDLGDMVDVSGARVLSRLETAKQRRIYGYIHGHVPTPIDSLLNSRYPLTGIVTATNGSVTVSGSGTSFLSELSPDDQIYIGDDEDAFTVEAIASDTSLTLTEEYSNATESGQSFEVVPGHAKRYINRIHLVAGHSLREPSTTVSFASSLSVLDLADTTDFLPDDEITVGSEINSVKQVVGTKIFLNKNLVSLPSVGTTVTRNSISNVYINDRLLVKDRDYTIDAANAKITLDPLAEFNVAPVVSIQGTVTFNGTRAVTGSGTDFRSDLTPGQWIRAVGQASFFEILSVESETALTLRSAATYSVVASAQAKRPVVYEDGVTTLSLDAIGKTDDGTKTGVFLNTASQIIEDLLLDAGVDASDIDSTSFTEAQGLASQRLGVAIPSRYTDRKTPAVKSVIDSVNKTVLGALVQDNEFKFKYNILEPTKSSVVEFDESDILDIKIKANSDRIVRKAIIDYKAMEYNGLAGGDTVEMASTLSDEGQYITKTNKEFSLDTLLVDETDAQILANRMVFLLQLASSVTEISTKLQGSRLEINDAISIKHEKLYERIGSTDKRKVAAIQAVRKNHTGSSIDIEDLANAYTRVATVTDNDVNDFNQSSEITKALNGYITDEYGMIDNDRETAGINLIW